MKTIILKVVEGRGKTGLSKTGNKRFLFTDNSIEIFNNFCSDYYYIFIKKFPATKLTRKDIRSQWLKLVLKYENVDVKDYECVELDTILRVGNISKLQTIKYLDIDKTLTSKRF